MIAVIEKPSPNYNERGNYKIDKIILHYTNMQSADDVIERFSNPASEVSSHYLIDTDGIIYQIVAEECRAWHAGVACWQDEDNINSSSIGIELQNGGEQFGYDDFPQIQINSLIELITDIKTRYKIVKQNILAHSDIAPNRKIDPDYKFPWELLAEKNLCIIPTATATDIDFMELLDMIGYDISADNVISAFQRRYRPNKIDGIADKECSQLAMGIIMNMEKI